jgi:nicotinamidase-related amidase
MWERPDPDSLAAGRTALLVFDMLEMYRTEIERSGVMPAAVRLLRICREAGVIVCFARAGHRPDGADYTRVVTDVDRNFRPWTRERPQPVRPDQELGGLAYQVLAELGPRSSDFDVPKHRWSAFHGTVLDTILRAQNIDSVLIIGGSTHVGVASTVYAGRDLDYQMIVVGDACTGSSDQREYFLNSVFPRVCRVRTVDDVRSMLMAGQRETG